VFEPLRQERYLPRSCRLVLAYSDFRRQGRRPPRRGRRLRRARAGDGAHAGDLPGSGSAIGGADEFRADYLAVDGGRATPWRASWGPSRPYRRSTRDRAGDLPTGDLGGVELPTGERIGPATGDDLRERRHWGRRSVT
jgi:hypothetical protein